MELLKKQNAIIEHFENVINQNKFDMLHIIVLYNMSCHDNYKKLNLDKKYKLLNIIYNFYMKDETKTDLAYISDIVMNNYNDILTNYQNTFSINMFISSNL